MRNGSFRSARPSRVGGIMNATLEELGLRHRILEFQAMAKWDQVVGPQIAGATLVQNVREGVLFVCCKSSTWCSELSLHKNDIVKRLNAAVGKKVVNDIRFSSKGYRKAAVEQKEEQSTRVKNLEQTPLAAGDEEAVAKAAAVTSSDELADRIRRAVMTSKRLNERKRQEGWVECPKCGELYDGRRAACGRCI